MSALEIRLSIVAPFRDGAADLRGFHGRLVEAMTPLTVGWEIVYVDDGSRDASPQILADLVAGDPRLQLVVLDDRYGRSAALLAGAEAAFGDWVGALDPVGGDDPRDLPRLWRLLARAGTDGVAGVTRGARPGGATGAWESTIFVLPRDAVLGAVRFDGMDRFLPVLARAAGYEVRDVGLASRTTRAEDRARSRRARSGAAWLDLLMVRRLVRRGVRYRTRGAATIRFGTGSSRA